jgi:DNA-binding beta-propeller fold protein YncE
LAVLALLVVAAYFLLESRPLELPPISSSVVVISNGSEKLIYVAASDQGEIQLRRATELSKPYARIPVGTSGNLGGERGRPEQMLAVKRGQSHLVFVTDTKSNKVHVIEGDTIIGSFSVGLAPRSLAVTPDGLKLFVSNEQPVPSGTIQAFDIHGRDPNKYVLTATIQNVTCPEGLALSPRGDLLYVATQCGGGKDPVFMFNTATNEPKGSIPNLAVGSSVAVSADGARLYVSRGNYPCTMSNGESGSPLSIVDTQSKKVVNTVCLHTSVGPIAISRDKDGRYLFVGNGDGMTVFDRKALDASDSSLNEITLGSGVSGFGVAEDNSVYAFVPGKALLYLYNPAGL